MQQVLRHPAASYSLKGTPNLALFGATTGFFVGFAAVALFGPTASQFQAVLKLPPALLALLIAAPALSGSLLRIPFSAWVDTTGGRKPFLILLSLGTIGMLGLFLVVTLLFPERLTPEYYPLLLLLGVLSGSGIATFSVGATQASYWFPQSRQGWSLGVFGGVGNLAPGIFSFLLPVALERFGLATAYLAWLSFLIVGTVLYYLLGRNCWYFQLREQGLPPEEARSTARELGQEVFPAGSVLDSLRISARVWRTWVLVVVYFTTFGGFIALTAWLPTHWQSLYEVSLITAGFLTALYSLLASGVRAVAGGVADRLGGQQTTAIALVTIALGSLVMAASQGFAVAVAAEVIIAVGMGVGNAAVFKLVPQEVPDAVGGAAGWIGGLGAFGGFVVPLAMGTFVGTLGLAGYDRGFVVFAALAVLSLLLLYVPSRSARPSAGFVRVGWKSPESG